MKHRLIHIVLILAHADALRVNLHQLAQRVHQTASDAHGAAHSNIIIRKFLASHIAGTIYRRTVFAHHNGNHLAFETAAFHHLLRLAARRAVADGYSLNLERLDQSLQFRHRGTLLSDRGKRINSLVMNKLPLCIKTHNLASRAESRVDSQRAFLAKRRCQQQLPKVLGKDLYRLTVSTFLEQVIVLRLNRRADKPLVAVPDGGRHLLRRLIVAANKLALKCFQNRFVVLRRNLNT